MTFLFAVMPKLFELLLFCPQIPAQVNSHRNLNKDQRAVIAVHVLNIKIIPESSSNVVHHLMPGFS